MAHLDYLVSYYDSNDKFAISVFGSIARKTQSPKGCSIDSLAYFRHRREAHKDCVLPEGYYLASTTHEDLAVLESFYEHKSGGLMMQSFDLVSGSSNIRGPECRRKEQPSQNAGSRAARLPVRGPLTSIDHLFVCAFGKAVLE